MRLRLRLNPRTSRPPIFAALAAVALLACLCPGRNAHAQSGAVGVRLAEIGRHEIFLPLYAAIEKGLFRREGLDVATRLTVGPDQTLAALLDGKADIALGGPDLAILSAIAAHGEKVKIVAALARFDGSVLVTRDRIAPDRFRWDTIKGKTLMGWRAGSMPAVFLEAALRHEHIDPNSDLDYRTNVPIPIRMRVWREGRTDFAVFYLADAARLERDKAGYAVATIGTTAGPSVYAVLLAREDYIGKHEATIQKVANAVQAALAWTASAPIEDLTATAAKHLPRAARIDLATAVEHYRPIGLWPTDATVTPDAIAKIEDMMIASGVMAPGKRVAYETVVAPRFAETAKRAAPR